MNDVKCADLVAFLAQNKENGVEELCKLAEEIPPNDIGHCDSVGIVGEITRLTDVIVFQPPAVFQHLEIIE